MYFPDTYTCTYKKHEYIHAKLSKKMECLICGCIVPVKPVCLRNGCLYSQYDLP